MRVKMVALMLMEIALQKANEAHFLATQIHRKLKNTKQVS